MLIQPDLFINVTKYTFKNRFKVIPIRLFKGIRVFCKLVMLPYRCLSSKQG